jgi:hypothetical protein
VRATLYSADDGDIPARRSTSRIAGLVRVLRQPERADALAQVGDLRLRVALLAELLADLAHLRAQEVLALAAVDLEAHLVRHVGLDAHAADRLLQDVLDDPQAIAHVRRRRDLALDGERQVHVRADEVGEASPAGDVHPEDLDHLLRVAALGADQAPRPSPCSGRRARRPRGRGARAGRSPSRGT